MLWEVSDEDVQKRDIELAKRKHDENAPINVKVKRDAQKDIGKNRHIIS